MQQCVLGLCVNSTQLSHVVSDQVGTLPTKTRPLWITGAGTRPVYSSVQCTTTGLTGTLCFVVASLAVADFHIQPWNQQCSLHHT
ncbi:hypothetical protein Pelo_19250 [Pelomyxa schiedti]|nr:hypothetical protein Pelo_19250 [Pelomyxa schiedti]